jgi:hypothetical protein
MGRSSARSKRQRSLDQEPRPAEAVADYRIKAQRGGGALNSDDPGRTASSCPNRISNNVGAQAGALNDDREVGWPRV